METVEDLQSRGMVGLTVIVKDVETLTIAEKDFWRIPSHSRSFLFNTELKTIITLSFLTGNCVSCIFCDYIFIR